MSRLLYNVFLCSICLLVLIFTFVSVEYCNLPGPESNITHTSQYNDYIFKNEEMEIRFVL